MLQSIISVLLILSLSSVSFALNLDSLISKSASSFINIQQSLSKCGNLSLIDKMDLFKMVDSGGKIPSGLATGNLYALGAFDECYGIKSETAIGTMYGKYCLSMSIKNNISNETDYERNSILTGMPDHNGLHYGICVPSWCSAENISGILNFTETFCYSKANEVKLSTSAIITIVLLSSLLGIAVLSTIYDIFLFYINRKVRYEWLLAFSFLTNGRKLITATTNPDQLLCLNGIKAISMMWVVCGHVFSNNILGPISNLMIVTDWQQEVSNMPIIAATISVDTFFVVAGLVTVYTFLKARDQGDRFNIFFYYLHRYLRLTPALAVMILIHLNLINYCGNGPLWQVTDNLLIEPCRTGWWKTILYISNYFNENYCIVQSWYLNIDMQLFALSPIILIPLAKWPNPSMAVLGFLIVASIIVPTVISYVYKFQVFMNFTSEFTSLYYMQTYARFGPYVIGMALGYVIYKVKTGKKPQLHPWLVLSIWMATLAGLLAIVYGGHDLLSPQYDRWGSSLFIGLHRCAWAFGVGIVIYLCVGGYGGPINLFLSHPVFQFLTKISYSIYLVHFTVVTIRYTSAKQTLRFSNVQTLHDFLGDFVLTIPLAILLCLLFESPIIILEKNIFGIGEKRAKVKNDEEEKSFA